MWLNVRHTNTFVQRNDEGHETFGSSQRDRLFTTIIMDKVP